ncbi:NAD-dependent epimerase/dehydratase family protein [Alkalicoccobacillus porphyridii]|uniref:NAD(P)-dependent oxidoreductase n=1 Tax=Alkalicoccobacillus porphyridii TaxID=2597270 RepID=A0A553ZXF7_9BACI|nr:NAD(P)-dependent oxidoreductase [Alkalicoccobacillus porphyridii]TSB46141.1 NAD(P)-dependent oxidoreductase [Alkalicoccobacillus porphyridii]
MKKAVVTGGLGFIGYHLCQALLEEGVEVICIDINQKEWKQEHEEKLMRMGRNALFEFFHMDLDQIDSRLKTHLSSADVVFHMASPVSKDSKWPMKHQTIHQANMWVQQLCEGMKENAKFIFPSTVEVYGDVPGLITEDTPLQPVSPYGVIKADVEEYIKKQTPTNSVHYQIVRLPTIYGPWQRPDMTFCQLIRKQQDIYQDRSTLDVLYVTDAVAGLILSANSNDTSEIYHLSSGEEGRWFTCAKLLGAEADLLKRTHSRSSLSPDKAKNQLGFEARMPIEEGIQLQIDHEKQWQKLRDV